ncbi:MAG: S41 family peptidase [Planctomycetota bacterium]|nr:S41 family peptidase [Planctomycetota bacterium]
MLSHVPRFFFRGILSGLIVGGILFCGEVYSRAASDSADASASEKQWMRYPAISPDGKTIAFSYRGDIWLVDRDGGRARLLTSHAGHERSPVWSPDGKEIAYAGDRNGNYDIFVVPIDGGPSRRVTYHSAQDIPFSYTPDGERILFASRRLDSADAAIGTLRMAELYSIPEAGGRPRQEMTTQAEYANFNPDQTKLVFHDYKGIEDRWRKHHTSSVTRDIVIRDAKTGKQTRLTPFEGEDRNPVWSADGEWIYYLSEEDVDNFNVWEMDPEDPSTRRRLTAHRDHPVRFLSVADDGTLAYGFNGGIWIKPKGQEAKEIEILAPIGDRNNDSRREVRSSGVSNFAVSPDEKEVALIVRGEVFVTNVEFGTTKRITNTPEQERVVSWGSDGRTLYYDSERGGSWNLYKSSIARDDDDSFADAVIVTEEPLLVTEDETFQPVVSPDGKQLAYLRNRDEIMVMDLESKKSSSVIPRRKNHSYADGDIEYAWSPDSRWLTATYHGHRLWTPEIAAVKLADGEVINVTQSGYSEYQPKFSSNGKLLLYATNRYGQRGHGSDGSEADVFGLYLNQEAFDEAHLSKAELALKKKRAKKKKDREEKEKTEKEKKEQPTKTPEEKGASATGLAIVTAVEETGLQAVPIDSVRLEDEKEKDKAEDSDKPDAKTKKSKSDKKDKKKVDPIEFDLENRDQRLKRMTLMSAPIGSFDVSPDGEVLIFTAKFEGKWGLWVTKLRDRSTTKAMNLSGPGHLQFTKDGKGAFIRQGKGVSKLNLAAALSGGKATAKPVKFSAELNIDGPAERQYIFDHVHRQTAQKFYDPQMHGVDWDAVGDNYEEFLPSINNNYDFTELLSEMLGELNASHTGARFYPRLGGDSTGVLGLLFDESHAGDGLKVVEVIPRGPSDKAEIKIEPGHLITHIDGERIKADTNHWQLLNHKSGKLVRLTLHDPEEDEEWEEFIRPTTAYAEGNLMYQRWIESRRKKAEELSNGRVGYVHVRGMDESSFRHVYSEVLGRNYDKEALIVDTRFNGGGWLHEDLATFLDGDLYCYFVPRGHERGDLGGEPVDKWTRPVAVLQSESNYSDAHFFPWAFKRKGIGKLIGAPVPGTSTAVWWESQIEPKVIFGIPQVGITDLDGRYLENWQLDPDVLVINDAESVARGEDKQLAKAIEELLREVDGAKNSKTPDDSSSGKES